MVKKYPSSRRRLALLILESVALLLLTSLQSCEAVDTQEEYNEKIKQHLELFSTVRDIEVLGPSIFPRPTDVVEGGQPFLKPTLGEHRSDKDAIFAYASEYNTNNYISFIESLKATGYDGDIVLSVSPIDMSNEKTANYLKSVSNLVVYVPELPCYNFEGEVVASAKGGIRTCQCHNLYAGPDGKPLSDPRPPRTIATIRYELYWLWTKNYNEDSWILLVDARDTFFQDNPFTHVPRKTDPSGKSGLLYFFGENVDATRLGKSKSNNKWLQNAYGNVVANFLKDKPTICSGATMGEQIAIEAYVRALSAEYDDTGVVLMGADQGFHNYLYYSGKLRHADAIHDIVIFDQGTGIVNNLGAMRTQELDEWGNGNLLKKVEPEKDGKKNYEIVNWDGTRSPVVHQFDRHKLLSDYFFKQRTQKLKMALQDK